VAGWHIAAPLLSGRRSAAARSFERYPDKLPVYQSEIMPGATAATALPARDHYVGFDGLDGHEQLRGGLLVRAS
jgi:hypothetical protein